MIQSVASATNLKSHQSPAARQGIFHGPSRFVNASRSRWSSSGEGTWSLRAITVCREDTNLSKRQVRRPEGVHQANDGTAPVMVDSSASIAPVPITVPVEILVPIAVRTKSPTNAPTNIRFVRRRDPPGVRRTETSSYEFNRLLIVVPAPRLDPCPQDAVAHMSFMGSVAPTLQD